ncbi:MAG: adenylylsulfate kinase, partial [Firmicutes bacterium]|nr:adenylylsulfate kinase [Bacillota bacterium]
ERAQGITIDIARCFFKTQTRNYIILDAPGHVEFLKNMVSGASRAEAALLVIDAAEGIQENSKRHAYLISVLGIRQIVVLINKMDLVNYDSKVFENIKKEYQEFLKDIQVVPQAFLPVSAFQGDNIAFPSVNMPWYQGSTVLQTLDQLEAEAALENMPFRMPVQDIYKFTEENDDRRIIAGTIETGTLKQGDKVIFYPSGKTSTIRTIEDLTQKDITEIHAGYAAGVTLTEQLFIKRGELAVVDGQKKPHVASRLQANLFWLGKQPLIADKVYKMKLGTAQVEARLEKIIDILDTADLHKVSKSRVDCKDVATCIFSLKHPVAFDLNENMPITGRFVLVDQYEIAGGGIITKALSDEHTWVREQILEREYKWEKSKISYLERARRYNQKAVCIFISGKNEIDKKVVAKALERELFEEGKYVYYMGMRNLLYGMDADIKRRETGLDRNVEHLRRMAETANIFLDAGLILIMSASEVSRDEFHLLSEIIGEEKLLKVFIGDETERLDDIDVFLEQQETLQQCIGTIKQVLKRRRFIFDI